MDDADIMAMVARRFNVVEVADSRRRGSDNRALLRAATELAPGLHILDSGSRCGSLTIWL